MKALYRSFLIALMLCCVFPADVAAQALDAAKKAYSPGWKYVSYAQHIDVNDDGSSTEKMAYSYTILSESMVQSSSEQTISYHEGDVLEDVVAYTLKADG